MDALALEVSRALQFFFTSTQFNQVDHIVLCRRLRGHSRASPTPSRADPGRDPGRQPLCEHEPEFQDSPENLAGRRTALLVACGLALRRFDS